jgi:hypothetical protein
MEPPRAFLLRTVTRMTTAQGAKREWFHNETSASEIADFLVALAPVFVRIFSSHTFQRIVR